MYAEIPNALIKLRKTHNYTQFELGKKLGMSRSKVSSWESGRRDLSVIDAIIISNYFDISLDCLLNPNKITRGKMFQVVSKYLQQEKLSDKKSKEIITKIEKVLKTEIMDTF